MTHAGASTGRATFWLRPGFFQKQAIACEQLELLPWSRRKMDHSILWLLTSCY